MYILEAEVSGRELERQRSIKIGAPPERCQFHPLSLFRPFPGFRSATHAAGNAKALSLSTYLQKRKRNMWKLIFFAPLGFFLPELIISTVT